LHWDMVVGRGSWEGHWEWGYIDECGMNTGWGYTFMNVAHRLRVSRPIGSLVWAPTPEISVFVGGELLADDLGALRAYGIAAKACCAGTFSRFRDVLQNPPNL
jgi:hypothetical protein